VQMKSTRSTTDIVDVNPLTVLVLSLALDMTVSTETVRECFDLLTRPWTSGLHLVRPQGRGY